MKKTIFIYLLMIFIINIYAQGETAVTVKTKGDIKLFRDSQTKAIRKGEVLYTQDKIFSANNSFAAFKFIDGCGFIKLFANSVLIIKSNKEKSVLKKTAFLEKGKVLSNIKKKFGPYQVETPGTIASIKGTQFSMDYSEDKKTTLKVFEGIVRFKNKEDGKEVDVEKGYKAISSGSGDIQVSQIEIIDEEMQNELGTNSIELQFENKNNEKKVIEIKYQ